MNALEARALVELRLSRMDVQPSDVTSVALREENGRWVAGVRFSWGRGIDMDLGDVDDGEPPAETESVPATETATSSITLDPDVEFTYTAREILDEDVDADEAEDESEDEAPEPESTT